MQYHPIQCRLGIQPIPSLKTPKSSPIRRTFHSEYNPIYITPSLILSIHSKPSPLSLIFLLPQQLPLRLRTIPPLHIRIPLLMHPYSPFNFIPCSSFLSRWFPSSPMPVEYAFRRYRWPGGVCSLMTG